MASYTPSRLGTPGGGLGTMGSPANAQASANTTLFRRMVWEGSVPLEIKISPNQLPADSDRALESYFLQVPRIAYLPFIIPDIRAHLAELVLNEREVGNIQEENWWFEDEHKGVIKAHWPVGLLYDVHVSSKTLSIVANGPNPPPITNPQPTTPLRLILHLANPSPDKVFTPFTTEGCKQAFMGQLKEADCLRWGNTKRVTGLRKAEQDGLWDAIRDHNFDDFWKVASKITPTPSPATSSGYSSPGTLLTHPSGPSADKDPANTVKSVPIRIYLPDAPGHHASIPSHASSTDSHFSPMSPSQPSPFISIHGTAVTSSVIQPLVPPLVETHTPNPNAFPNTQPATLRTLLESHLPLLFPRAPQPPLAHAMVQGVVVPDDAELAWLGACMGGPDGWLSIIISMGRPS